MTEFTVYRCDQCHRESRDSPWPPSWRRIDTAGMRAYLDICSVECLVAWAEQEQRLERMMPGSRSNPEAGPSDD